MTDCTMIMIEDQNLEFFWECDHCKTIYRDMDDFDHSKECPNCKSTITDWEFIEGTEEDLMEDEDDLPQWPDEKDDYKDYPQHKPPSGKKGYLVIQKFKDGAVHNFVRIWSWDDHWIDSKEEKYGPILAWCELPPIPHRFIN